MKNGYISVGLIAAACLLLSGLSGQALSRSAPDQSDDNSANSANSAFFGALKETMTGSWEGQYTNGTFEQPTDWDPVRVEYRLTANGTALIEDYLYGDSPSVGMTTVYFQDRGDLRLTHYCGARNHPSMVATMLDASRRQVRFDFTNISNLKNPDDYHSRQFELDIVSDDHVRIQYNGLQNGKIASQAYDLKRTAP